VASRPFSLHRLASREIEHERRYYQRRVARGADLIEAVEDALSRMSGRPDSFAPRATVRAVTIRSVRLKGFPFRLYFGDLGDALRVYALAHERRRPGYWSRRVGG
jgi:hypothetical protein